MPAPVGLSINANNFSIIGLTVFFALDTGATFATA